MAAVAGNLEIMKHIVSGVATLEKRDIDGCTALLTACRGRNWKSTEVRTDHGAKINVHDKFLSTPLYKVQNRKGDTAVTKLLLTHPSQSININAETCYDKTTLHLAYELGNRAMVDLLIEYNADINCHGPYGCTPLHVAIDQRRLSVVKILLDRGAETLLYDANKRYVMKAAETTRRGSWDIIKMVEDHEVKPRRKRKQS